ncbi:TIGR02221 family CRISPR-associated protein [Desulfobacterales bacterium HSG17]|nr:TIGR02221 family CRISPR-associated protein [Desulfobacterales bacterium HSG17]
MRKVYMSFLGLGFFDKEKKEYRYTPTTYELNNAVSKETEFVQVAEMELLNAKEFDLVLIIATEKSYKTHFSNLEMQMKNFEVYPVHLEIDEKMDSKSQWQWFEKILCYIEIGDELTVDLTHGYRSVPIVFSAAINFLQKAKNIKINAVYYGAFEANRGSAPIIDMKDFYNINEWAESVTRLVEDADARKMAEVAGKASEIQMGELNDPEVIETFENLTNTIRNVDVNNVAEKAEKAIELIREKKKHASETGKILLDLVIDKFVCLTTGEPVSGMYDKAYFNIQLKIIRLLLDHRLYMQAYTVMRELIGSIGMIPSTLIFFDPFMLKKNDPILHNT